MTQTNNEIMHGLMTDMQIVYYWAFLFDSKGEPRIITEENIGAVEAGAAKACKGVALRAIKQRTIPKRMYVYANAFALHDKPIEIIDRTYHLYALDNAPEAGVKNASVGEPA